MGSRALKICAVLLCSGVIGYVLYEPIFGRKDGRKKEYEIDPVPAIVQKDNPGPQSEPDSAPEPQPEPQPEPVVVTPEPDQPEEVEAADEDIAEIEAEDEFEIQSITRTPAQLRELQEWITKMSKIPDSEYIGRETPTMWKRPDNAKKRLAARIVGALKKKTDKDILLFIGGKNGLKNRLALAQWVIMDKADSEQLALLCKDAKFRSFMGRFMNDLHWVESFVYAGACRSPEKAIEILAALAAHDPDILDGRSKRAGHADSSRIKGENASSRRSGEIAMKRRIATAIAAEYGRNGWTFSDEEEAAKFRNLLPPKTDLKDRFSLAKARYDYFVSSWRKGLLNPVFDELEDWDLRIVCGWKDKNGHGSAKTLRWMRDNASLPEEEAYNAACQVPYRLVNLFGDSIHSEEYYRPFNNYYYGNFNKEVRDIGAVCGGNAHFGASSCIAQGIPAMTMGEPGHCAYAVRVNGKWKRNFSVSPKHGMHWELWGERAFSFLDLAQGFYSEGYRTKVSQQVAAIASVLAQNRNPKNSVVVYELATDIQPLNYPAWSSFFESLKNILPHDKKKWMQVNEAFCRGMGSKHPEVCMTVLNKQVYPALMGLLRTREEKLKVCEDFLNNMDRTEDEPKWGLEKLLQSQAALFGAVIASSASPLGSESDEESENVNVKLSSPSSRDDLLAYFKMMTRCLMGKPAFAADAMSWGSEFAGSISSDMQNEFTQMALQASGNARGEDKESLLKTALVGAENNQNIATFQSIAKKFGKKEPNLPKIDPYPGELLSSGGLIRFSSLSPQYDDPSEHPGVIETSGGRFHTNNSGENEWAEVVMRRPGTVTGIVIVTMDSNEFRLHDWRVETSMDGNAWTPLSPLPDRPKQNVIYIDGKNTQCQRVRVFRDGKDFFHLRAIHVYGRKNA